MKMDLFSFSVVSTGTLNHIHHAPKLGQQKEYENQLSNIHVFQI